jgi:protein TonB
VLQSGIEGYVTVEFDFTTYGTVENMVIVESQPNRLFDKATMQAISQFRFLPKYADGRAVRAEGVRFTKSFGIVRRQCFR